MQRRDFLKKSAFSLTTLNFILIGCGREEPTASEKLNHFGRFDSSRILWFDINAMALYMDGSLGPKTGVIKAEYLIKNEPVTLAFWHGHGGKNHQFTLLPEHYASLKQSKKVLIVTTSVDGHTHKLFIDPNDPKWRVPGVKPTEI